MERSYFLDKKGQNSVGHSANKKHISSTKKSQNPSNKKLQANMKLFSYFHFKYTVFFYSFWSAAIKFNASESLVYFVNFRTGQIKKENRILNSGRNHF